MKRPFLAVVFICVLCGATPAFAQASSATFAWNADAQTVSGYYLYWGTATGNYPNKIDAGNNLQLRVVTLPILGPVYVTVTAYDNPPLSVAFGQSAFSSELVIYSLSATSDANSTISPAGTFWQSSGASQTFTITPKPGYVSVINVDGALIGVSNGSYALTGMAANHTISIVSMAQIPAPAGLSLKAGQ